MNKNVLSIRREARLEGVNQGFMACEAALLLAMYNVNEKHSPKRYMGDEAFSKFCRETEAELNRLYIEECGKYGDAFADAIIKETFALRERLGMDE